MVIRTVITIVFIIVCVALSALVLLDALVSELMHKLNLREKDLKAYHDVLSSSI